MNETISGTVIKGIETLSATIKNLAPEIWRIYIKQQYVYGTGFAIATFGCFYSYYKANKFFKQKNKDKSWDRYDDFEKTMVLIWLILSLLRILMNMSILPRPVIK